MLNFTVNEKEYILKFTFSAAENKNCVQDMFKVLSNSYVMKNASGLKDGDEEGAAIAFVEGVSEMIADIPRVCANAFYAGLLEENPMSENEAKMLMRAYMTDNKLSYNGLFEVIKQTMEDDGFFDLSGLAEILEKMSQDEEKPKKRTTKKTTQK